VCQQSGMFFFSPHRKLSLSKLLKDLWKRQLWTKNLIFWFWSRFTQVRRGMEETDRRKSILGQNDASQSTSKRSVSMPGINSVLYIMHSLSRTNIVHAHTRTFIFTSHILERMFDTNIHTCLKHTTCTTLILQMQCIIQNNGK
jgi:hypothetical protein